MVRKVYATAKAALIESLRTKHRIAIDKALEWGSIEINEFNEKGFIIVVGCFLKI